MDCRHILFLILLYHYNKLVTRGNDIAVDVLGADHHGYVPRMKAALTALGIDAGRLNCVIMQMVRLVRDGETICFQSVRERQ